MRHLLLLTLLAVPITTPIRSAVDSPTGYLEVKDWPKLPAGVELGEVPGVDVDAHGHVFVFHRPGRGFEPDATEVLAAPAVLEIDADSGRLIASWGAGMFLVPHGITVDGENNIWLTDVGLQQVFKFSHDGKLLLTVGQPRVGGWDATHFNQPTDIAIRTDGSFYISDGYVNSRVALFDRRGAQIGEWGWKGNTEGAFSNPHGLAFGPGGDIFVADRENSRIQIFDGDGVFKRQWLGAQGIGRVFAVAVDAAGAIYAGVRRADYDPPSNGVLKLDRAWQVTTKIGFGATGDPVFNAVHDLAIGRDGSIYVAETRTKRVVKLRPR
ncbi:MAG TPA: peptidyl-alpha-hydroxyglycine alpha-amidating lyase family protein [Vicinamibacterales bacterium]|nr:peptidyl-alpha-hydroxyglycine alpha-amidating lyase family protein [Vicinamibacterales bacterium]